MAILHQKQVGRVPVASCHILPWLMTKCCLAMMFSPGLCLRHDAGFLNQTLPIGVPSQNHVTKPSANKHTMANTRDPLKK